MLWKNEMCEIVLIMDCEKSPIILPTDHRRVFSTVDNVKQFN